MKFASLLYGRQSGSSRREPMVEQRPCNREARRRLERRIEIACNGRSDLLAGEPARVVKLGEVDGQLVAECSRVAAEHERRRKWPWLARDIGDLRHRDSRFLVELASDRSLDRFAGLEEAGEGRIASGRILWLAA